MQSTLSLPVIGLDLAKSVFQLHIVDVESGEIQRRQIKRVKLTEFFAKYTRRLVAMEACGSSHLLGQDDPGAGTWRQAVAGPACQSLLSA